MRLVDKYNQALNLFLWIGHHRGQKLLGIRYGDGIPFMSSGGDQDRTIDTGTSFVDHHERNAKPLCNAG